MLLLIEGARIFALSCWEQKHSHYIYTILIHSFAPQVVLAGVIQRRTLCWALRVRNSTLVDTHTILPSTMPQRHTQLCVFIQTH